MAHRTRAPREASLALALVACLSAGQAAAGAGAWQEKVDPWVLETAERASATEFLVVLAEQADLSQAARLHGKVAKGTYVFRSLTATAARTQGPVLAELRALGAEHRPYWVANMVWVRGGLAAVEAMARRRDVARVAANPRVRMEEPLPAGAGASTEAIEWNLQQIGAPGYWAQGVTGQGAVVGGQDTGYDWDHPALIDAYRGWNGATADHDYNWHDSIHAGGGVCGPDSSVPCDDSSHGTHTMGTMVGDDGAGNQVGVAPGARWIGCRNMDQGAGTPATYSECFQWFIAPTDVAGLNPDPTKAPHVINNSWSCPPSEGCTDPNVLRTVVENARAAGIVVVVSAGNSGSGCSSVSTPAAIYEASFTVGAVNSSGAIAGFSSRGPVTVDSSNRLKPNVAAPGVFVRSSIPGGAYSSFSGTSMAGPHVAGQVALLIAASPDLAGEVDALESCIEGTAAAATTTQECGGIPGSQVPNNTYGWGEVRLIWPPPPGCRGSSIFTDGFESGGLAAWSTTVP